MCYYFFVIENIVVDSIGVSDSFISVFVFYFLKGYLIEVVI